ncbi:hypothetical protein RN001_012244 [Aquatica leii]|uniref:Uncharacterized protein n=1 Tax=Aquatica leii TaxID=1421715 RepID=A0AAN7SD77_9COLE|nr:hypothetical protein RN001_012244 [Aquatica leii]
MVPLWWVGVIWSNHNGWVSFFFSRRFVTIVQCKDDWDIFVFTQHWPFTVCSQWIKKNFNNICRLPDAKDTWTIHGLWPTKYGTIGPSFCNDNLKFDESKIARVQSKLEQLWTNIHKNKPVSYLWEHEWNKHGTCAVTLPQLNNQLQYFTHGLELIRNYNITNILSNYFITPGFDGYNVENIFNSIKTVLNHNPVVRCVVDKDSNRFLISEIQICFDKQFNVIDCDPVKKKFRNGGILTDCSLTENVFYPNQALTLRITKTSTLD